MAKQWLGGRDSGRRRGQRGGEVGQALVEFMLVVVVLLLTSLLAVDVGRSFYVKERLTNAAREGAFWQTNHKGATTAVITEHVVAEAGYEICDGGSLPAVTLLTGSTDPSKPTYNKVGVAVRCRFRLVMPFAWQLVDSQVATSGTIDIRSDAWAPKPPESTP